MSTHTLNLSSNSFICWFIPVSAVKVICFFFVMVCIFSFIWGGFLRSPNKAYLFISHRTAWCSCNNADLYVGGISFASQQGQKLSYGFSWFPQSLKENAVPVPPVGYVEQSCHSTLHIRDADATVKWTTYKNACSRFCLRQIPPYLVQSILHIV